MNLGVIIPAYNAEKTIRRCLESVLSNRCVRKVAVVDDGSSDNTRLIIQEIMGTDYRVELITSMNNGPSYARRDGLKNLVRGGNRLFNIHT